MRPWTIDHHWFRWWLVACSAPSHHLNQCWLIVIWARRNTFQWNFSQVIHFFSQAENAFEHVVCKMTILLCPQRIMSITVQVHDASTNTRETDHIYCFCCLFFHGCFCMNIAIVRYLWCMIFDIHSSSNAISVTHLSVGVLNVGYISVIIRLSLRFFGIMLSFGHPKLCQLNTFPIQLKEAWSTFYIWT